MGSGGMIDEGLDPDPGIRPRGGQAKVEANP